MIESTEVYTSRNQSTMLDTSATLEGGVILPGFTVPLSALFRASPL
jgi:pantothenate kinase type III